MIHYLLFSFFLLNSITQTISQNILISTNYTKFKLSDSDSNRVICTENTDCPFGSFCNENLCLFNSLLCYDREDANCMYLNETIWDPFKEKLRDDFKNIQEIPLIKTCTIDEIIEKKCETKKCYENKDCFSGLCYSGYCATKETIYYCKDYNSIGFTCKSFNNMKCLKNSDCSHTFCNNSFCTPSYLVDYTNIKNSIRIILLILCSLYLVNKYIKNKKRRT